MFQYGTTSTETEDATPFSSQPNTNHGGGTTVGVDGDHVLHTPDRLPRHLRCRRQPGPCWQHDQHRDADAVDGRFAVGGRVNLHRMLRDA